MLFYRHSTFYSCIVNTKKLVCNGYHINLVWFSLGAFLFKKLIHRLIFRLSLKIYSYFWNNIFRRVSEPRLDMLLDFISMVTDWCGGRSIPTIATKAFPLCSCLISPISAISWHPSIFPTPYISMNISYLDNCDERASISECSFPGISSVELNALLPRKSPFLLIS